VAVALYMARLGRHRWELAVLALVAGAAAVLVSLPPPTTTAEPSEFRHILFATQLCPHG
jgi:hypothetical protein